MEKEVALNLDGNDINSIWTLTATMIAWQRRF